MLAVLTARTLAVLLAFPGISGLPHLPHFGLHRTHTKAVQDTLPPAWKSASRLALEDQFVRLALKPPPLLRPERLHVLPGAAMPQFTVAVNADSGRIQSGPQLGTVSLEPGAERSLAQYSHELTLETYHRLWVQKNHDSLNSLGALTPQGGLARTGLSFQLPSPLPPRIQSLLGPGGPALNVSGSENISLSGTSNWTNQQTTLLGQQRSLFPSLDMQQNLDIQLEGQLSDRIKVNLLQNSANQIPLANRIAINYKGGEDDLVQELDLGNTNLALPGTQYVSYSGKNEGLFGMKTALRYGPLDFAFLASKQEGKSERASYAGGSSKQSQILADMDYVHGAYFFLSDPNAPTQLIDEGSVRVFKDDGNYGNSVNKVRGRAMVDPNGLDISKYVTQKADTASVRGSFAQLIQGSDKDYDLLHDIYGPNFRYLRLHVPLSGEQRLAVTYTFHYANDPPGTVRQEGGNIAVAPCDSTICDTTSELILKLIRAPASLLKPDSASALGGPSAALFDTNFTSSPLNATRELELKNFYQLGGQNIDPKTFTLTIEKGTFDPPHISFTTTGGVVVPYIEALGLDGLDESGGTPVKGHDNKVDGTQTSSNTRVFVDYTAGTLFMPDLRPFSPRINARHLFEQAVDSLLNRRGRLDGPVGSDNEPSPAPYDKYLPLRSVDPFYYMDVEFTAQRAAGDIYLGRSNIIEGSDVVTINGQQLQRDKDYTIDYELGRITLKRQLGPADNLNIDYSYAPLFQQAGRTLLGSAFRWGGQSASLGGAFMYESKGAQDLRPRLGEEPSRSLIADLNTAYDVKPDWMTRLADRLPGVRTTTPSEFNVQAEAGQSFPNPNTKNVVYVDDMEGVRDAVSLTLDPLRWRLSSVPSVLDSSHVVRSLLDAGYVDTLKNAEIHWFSPPSAVKENELKPNLTEAQGGLNYQQVLSLSIPRRPKSAPNGERMWAGLTYVLDANGLDLSRSQFIELWVNDWRDPRLRGGHVKLHLDLGRVSEAQMLAPDHPPTTTLLTEDLPPRDNVLQLAEDVGIDGMDDVAEQAAVAAGADSVWDLATANPSDPHGDDFHGPDATFELMDPRRYGSSNGTEGNHTYNPTPDTEDLNLNQNLDTAEDFFEYTIDLGAPSDTTNPYLIGDTYRDFGGQNSDNGWRRYRIPIGDSLAIKFNNPNLSLAQHLRLWLQGVPGPDTLRVTGAKPGEHRALLEIGSIDIVGNRWLATGLTDHEKADGTTMTLNSVNTVDNAESYVAPFDPGQTLNGNQELTRREQSLSLEFTQLHAGDALEAFKTFSVDEDYSRYGALDWFIAGFEIPTYVEGRDSLEYFVRFASDELGQNYYEYRAPVPASSTPGHINWSEIKLKLTDMSNLKLLPRFPRRPPVVFDTTIAPGVHYAIVGQPSFTRLRRISYGIESSHLDSTRVYPEGQLWLDEIRAVDVARDVGHAGRVLVNGHMANLINYNMSWDGRDADFITVGESRGLGSTNTNFTWNSSIDLHRFIEGTGIVLPLSFNYATNSSRPRFSAGDDVVRTGALAEASLTRNDTRGWAISYARTWSDRSNPFLRYTIGGLHASLSQASFSNRNPNTVGTGSNFGEQIQWAIAPRKLFSFTMPGTPIKVFPLPENVFYNYGLGINKSTLAQRSVDSTGHESLIPLSDLVGRNAAIDMGADMRPVDAIHHHIDAHRNLTLPDPLREQWGFINLGRVVSWRQSTDAHYTLQRGPWLRPALAWGSSYNQNNGPELSPDLSVRAFGNAQQVTGSWDLPFDRLGLPAGTAGPPAYSPPGGPGTPGAAPSPPARPDSTHGIARVTPPPLWKSLLAHLGTVGTDGSFDQSSAYSRMVGTPDFFYLFGLSQNPGLGVTDSIGRVRPQFGNTTMRADDWRLGAHSRISLGYGIFLTTRAEESAKRNVTSGVESHQSTTHFPYLDFEYGTLAHIILLDRLLLRPQIHTTFDRTRSNDFANGSSSPTGIATSSEWRPLISMNGDLKNGARTELRIERRVTQQQNLLLGNSIQTDRNTDVKFNISRSYSQGQKVNFLGKESTVKSTVSLALDAVYSRRSGETIQTAADGTRTTQLPVLEDRLSLTGTGSYGFSTNVTGNASLGFGQNRDMQRGIVNRNIRVELRAQFTF